MSQPTFIVAKNKPTTKTILDSFHRFLLFACCFFFLGLSSLSAQLEVELGLGSFGQTRDGRFVICQNVVLINTDPVNSVCNPQIEIDLSAYPSITEIIIDAINGSAGFDITDIDPSSASVLSATNTTGNIIDPSTSKCMPPNGRIFARFLVYADPSSWPDGNTYIAQANVSGNNTALGAQNGTDTFTTFPMYDSDVIMGASIAASPGITFTTQQENIPPNNDGTYDFTYRVTIGNYDNDADTGGIADNILYQDVLEPLFNNMPINSISVGSSTNGNLTTNPSFNGGATLVGGVAVTADDILINGGILNPDEVDYVDVTFNVGPIAISQKNENRFTTGFVYGDDALNNTVFTRTANGLDPTDGNPLGPAAACSNGEVVVFDYQANLNVTKEVQGVVNAASGIPGNYDITYEVTVASNSSNDVNIYRLAALNDIATHLGSDFVGVTNAPIVTNINATSPPTANSSFDGSSGTGQGSNIDLLAGNSTNVLEPGQSFRINFTIEVNNTTSGTYLNNLIYVQGDNLNNENITNQAALSSYSIEDFDADGVPNNLDLDNDNDGILNTNESCQVSNNATAIWDSNAGTVGGQSGSFDPTLIQSTTNIIAGAGVSFGFPTYGAGASFPEDPNAWTATSMAIDNVEQNSLTNAISSNDYLQLSFTTANFTELVSLNNIFYKGYFLNSNGNKVGGNYDYAVAISSDNFVNSTPILNERPNGLSGTFEQDYGDISLFQFRENLVEYALAPATTYTVRLYFFNSVSANQTINLDDISFGLNVREDSDGDGLADCFDTDSDGDGCFDTVEAGHTDDDNDGILGTSPVTVDTNGQVTGQGGYTGTFPAVTNFTMQNACLDTDNDGVPDNADLDDDNDGILDSSECSFTDSGLDGTLPFTFDITSTDPNNRNVPHTLNSITHAGIEYNDFVVPSGFQENINVVDEGRIQYIENGVDQFSKQNNPNFDTDVLIGFQSRNLNSYINLQSIGNYADGDFYELTYNTPIYSTNGGFLAVTERGGNNPQIIQGLDENGNPVGPALQVNPADYTDLGHQVNPSNTQTVFMALYPIDDLAPVGARIHGLRISFGPTATTDAADTKVFFFGNLSTVSCDTDGDGISNIFDLDSDNDGCFDTVEAGHTDDDNDGILGISPVTVDSNGQVTGQGGYTGVTGNEVVATRVNMTTPLVDQTIQEKSPTFFRVGLDARSTTVFNAGVPDYAAGTNTNNRTISSWQANGVTITNDGTYYGTNGATLYINDVTGLDGTVYTYTVRHLDNDCILLTDTAVLNTTNPCDAVANGLPDADGDGVADDCDLDDDNDGIPDIHEQGQLYNCAQSFVLDGAHNVNTHTTTQLNSTTADGITIDYSTVNGVQLDLGVTPASSNIQAGPYITPQFLGPQDYLQIGILTDRNAGQQATVTINFPGAVKNPTILFSQLKDRPGVSPGGESYNIYYDLTTPNTTIERVAGDPTFVVTGNRIGATLNYGSPNGTGIVKFKGIFTQLTFDVGFNTADNTDGLITTSLNIGYYACTDTGFFAADDTDGDGIINSLDLDSDNDGIFDVVEAGHNQANTNGRITGDVGYYGIPDLVKLIPDYSHINYQIAESAADAEAIPNFLDLDSDGDGIPDNVEAQTTIGYTLPNGTYNTEGLDTAYLSGLLPVNTDGADLPDYLDLDSDNEGGNDTAEANITITNTDTDNDGLDDATDATADYSDVGGTIDNPLTAPITLPDTDGDAATGGDVDFRDSADDTDNDNDGVPDSADVDDDNDGILDETECNDISLFDNGDFSQFITTPPGWTLSGNQWVVDSERAVFPEWNGTGTASFEQAIAVTSGQTYQLTFDVGAMRRNTAGSPVNLDVLVDGAVIYSEGSEDIISANGGEAQNGNQTLNMSRRTVSFVASSSSIVVRFDGVSIAAPHDILFVDNVGWLSCQDTDSDGTPDYLDLDSDNDGCFDAVESGGTDANGDGILDGDGVNTDGQVTTAGAITDGYDGVTGNEILAVALSFSGSTINRNVVVTAGDDATFAIAATVSATSTTDYTGTAPNTTPDYSGASAIDVSGGINYQWYAGDADAGGVILAGETGETLTITNPVLTDNGDIYSLVITHDDNSCVREIFHSVLIVEPDLCDPISSGYVDSDGDGISDYCDLDDDNDGILDTDEGGTVTQQFIGGYFSPADQYFTVPANVTEIEVKIWGAGGGGNGGAGGFVYGVLPVTPGEEFTIMAGNGGNSNTGTFSAYGFNGPRVSSWYPHLGRASGGGLAGIFTGTDPILETDQARAVMIAGAGGAGYHDRARGGNGGDVTFGGGMPTMLGGGTTPLNSGSAGGGYNGGLAEQNRLQLPGSTSVHGEGGSNFVRADVLNALSLSTIDDASQFLPAFVNPPYSTDVNDNNYGVGVSVGNGHAGHGKVVISYSTQDTDLDGVADRLDLDSDNDGILDAIEAGHNQPQTNGIVTGAVGLDGVPNLVQTDPDNGLVNYTLLESGDADTIFDFLDLDADGDGIPDNVEAQTTIGYIAPNADNAATYATNNGINSAYLGGISPTNTDGADQPDYLDLDSDNEGGNDTAEANITLTNTDTDNDGLDDATDATADYSDVGGTIDNPLTAPIILPDTDADAAIGGDVDFRDASDDRTDTDLDGVPDDVDIDDDNDGILDSEECGVQLITGEFSGTFGTIDASRRNTGSPVINYTYSSTNLNSSGTYAIISQLGSNTIHPLPNYWDGLAGHTDGSPEDAYLAVNGSTLQGIFYSEDFTLTSNSEVSASIWTINAIRDGSGLTGFDPEVGFRILDSGGAIVATATSGPMPRNNNWTQVSVNFNTGSETQFTLEIINFSTTSNDNDFAIDDLRIFQTSSCLDTDGDTILNYLDLDSDNDGIPDNVEAQTTIGYIAPNADNAATYATNNGINSAYLGGISPANTDGADQPDYLDLDSDNEGGNDTAEANITLTNTDTDNDGLDDATDATADYSDVGGTIDNPLTAPIILPDTDADAAIGGDVDFRDAGIRTYSINDATGFEGASLTHTITATESASQDIIFNLSYTNVTTTAADYSGPNTVTLPAGDTSVSFNVAAIDDGLIEPQERYEVRISSSTPVAYSNDLGEGLISNINTSGPGEGIFVAGFTVAEDVVGGVANFVISYTGPTVQNAFTVDFNINDNTALLGPDFTIDGGSANTDRPGSVTFPANTVSDDTQNVEIGIVNDGIIEPTETLTLNITGISNGSIIVQNNTATGTITDDDSTGSEGLSIVQTDVIVTEGVGVTATFDVTLTGDYAAGFDVDFSTAFGTATATDFTPITNGTISFLGNDAEVQQITVSILNDGIIEPQEAYTVVLNSTTNPLVPINDATANGIINDDDSTGSEGLSIVQTDVIVTEGVGVTATFDVTLTGDYAAGFDVDFSTAFGTATATDFTPITNGTISFLGNDAEVQQITVSILNDGIIEPQEAYTVILNSTTNPLVPINDATANGIINDDDSTGSEGLSIVQTDVIVTEGVGVTATFDVTLTGDYAAGFDVDFSTAFGTATATDFTPITNGTLTFAGTDGEVQQITVTILNDGIIEPQEAYTVVLNSTTNPLVPINDATANGIINDDDSTGSEGLSIVQTDVIVTEGVGVTATFDVTLTGDYAAGFDVDFSTAFGTATATDFTPITNGTLTFAGTDGEVQQITVTILNDGIIEPQEAYTVVLNSTTNPLVPINDATANGIINDDDSTGSEGLSIVQTDVIVTEGVGVTATFDVTLTGDYAAGFDVDFSTAFGTATATDFTPITNGTLTFAGTDAEVQQITVSILNDGIIEPQEAYTVVLNSTTNPLVPINDATANGIINDDDSTGSEGLSIVQTDVIVTEGVGVTATFDVTLTGDYAAGFDVDFSTAFGTATATDFTPITNGTISFLGNDAEVQQITVSILNDGIIEPQEAYTVVLNSTTNPLVPINDATANGIINDDDSTGSEGLSIVQTDVIVTEGVGVTATFDVTLTGDYAAGFDVDFSTAFGTATATDFTPITNGTLTFAGTDAEVQQITVSILNDGIIEPQEAYTVILNSTTNPLVPINDGTANGIINDDDSTGSEGLSIVQTDVIVTEGVGVTATFDVTLTGDYAAGFDVDFSTAFGTATATDFTPITNGTLTFAGTDGEVQQITVTILNDGIIEPQEAYTVVLNSTTNPLVPINDATANGIINDDDSTGSEGLSIVQTDVIVTEGVGVTATFDVTLTGDYAAGFDVDFSTAFGTATATDFTPITNGTLTFAGTDAEVQQITVSILNDGIIEPQEAYTVVLNSTTNPLVPINDATANGIINDDDSTGSEGLSIVQTDVIVTEGVGVTATFDVTLTGDYAAGFDVDFSTAFGTATAADFTPITNGTISFLGNDAEVQQITVSILNDGIIEPQEAYTVILNSTTNPLVPINDATANGIINDDDSTGSEGLSIVQTDVIVTEGVGVTATFDVTLTGDYAAGFDVDFSTAFGTATATDFTPITNGTLTFAGTDGEVQQITVTILNDGIIEPQEAYTVVLNSTTNPLVPINDATANGIINDDDSTGSEGLSIVQTDVIVTEGVGVTATFDVTLTGDYAAGFDVDFSTAFGTATATDFTPITNGTLTFAGTDAEVQQITVTILNDDIIEPQEAYTVVLNSTTNPLVPINDGTANGIINDDDSTGSEGLSIVQTDVIVTEGVGVTATFDVTLTGDYAAGFDVDFSTAFGTATATDFTPITNGTISFLGNDAEVQQITVSILNDDIIEPQEAYTVTLNSTTNPLVPINDATANGIINDDDNDPTFGVQFDITSIDIDEGAGTVSIDVVLNANVQDEFTVEYHTIDGTATDAFDYTGIATGTQVLTFGGANSNTQTITIPIIDDVIIEDTENFNVILSNLSATPVTILANDTATINIIDNDGNEGWPTNVTIEACDTIPPAEDITSTTACAITVVLAEVIDGDTDDCPTEYTITRTWTITDCVGNVREHVQVITIEDTVAPTFVEALPQSMTVECNMVPNAAVLTATDSCETNITVDFEETVTNDENCTTGYTITRNWTASDCAGNTVEHSQIITIEPTGPIMSSPFEEEMTIICGEDVPEVPELTFTGGCGNYDVIFEEEVQNSVDSDDYMIIRTWTVTDSCDNSATFEQIIFVLQPQLQEITIDICIEEEAINLINFIPEGFNTDGEFTILEGNVNLLGNLFDPLMHEPGTYTIAYSSTGGTCNYYVDFTINVNTDCVPCGREDIEITKAITPNGDGINDYLEIKGIEFCNLTFDIMLFNRWGAKVAEIQNYQNDWYGEAPNGSFGSSGMLPTGTYYYIISPTDNDTGTILEPFNGYIYLGTQ